MKARIRRTLSLALATSMVFSCASLSAWAQDGDENTDNTSGYTVDGGDTELTEDLPFASDTEGKDIMVVDSTKKDRSYDLYQIFNGTLSDDALINITWGDSIVYSTTETVDGQEVVTNVYDYSDELVEALKEEKLPNGETNPLKSDFAALDKYEGKYLASDVASIIKNYEDKSEEIDAFMTAVAEVLTSAIEDDGAAILKRSQDKFTTLSTGNQYTFAGVVDGYYLVNETSVASSTDTTFTYSKYMASVGTGTVGTKIFAKATDGPQLEKKIQYGEDKADTKDVREDLWDYKSVAIGETVDFNLSSSVPNMDGYNRYYFIINDTLSASMTYKGIKSVKIGDKVLHEAGTADGENKANAATDDDESYEVVTTDNADGTTSIQIIFKNFIQYKAIGAGKDADAKKIEVIYQADVDEDVVSGETNANYNHANLTYSNNPNYNYEGTKGDNPDPDKPGEKDPTITTPGNRVYVYTAGVELIKIDSNGKRLSGAKFKLTGDNSTAYVMEVVPSFTAQGYSADAFGKGETAYYKLRSDSYTSDAPTTESKSRYVTENKKYTLTEEGTYTEDVNGTYLKDTTTNEYVLATAASSSDTYEQGYVLYKLTESVEVKSTTADSEADGSTKSVEGTVSADNGTVSFDGLGVGTYTITETEAPAGYTALDKPVTVTISFDSAHAATGEGKFNYSFDNGGNSSGLFVTAMGSDGVYEVEVKNLSTHTLPTTGGIGTTIFYTAGSIMAIAAAVLLIVKRRMEHESEEQ
jgi:fimbrial isopeptide formation D2 family protein/LPXTG-motif cell wall-anchored protein